LLIFQYYYLDFDISDDLSGISSIEFSKPDGCALTADLQLVSGVPLNGTFRQPFACTGGAIAYVLAVVIIDKGGNRVEYNLKDIFYFNVNRGKSKIQKMLILQRKLLSS
jgi:hypothetical protein